MKQTEINSQYESRLLKEILKVCHKFCLNLHDNKIGPKIFTNYQRVTLIILFLRSKKSLRKFISEFHETKWSKWLGLRELPTRTSLHRWIQSFKLKFLRNFNQLILSDEKPKIMCVDATGIDSWQRSRHYAKRINDSNMPYAKADILIDSETMLVHDFVLRMKPRHDVLGAKTMFQRLKRKNQGILVLADKGYDSESIHELVNNSGNKFYAPVRNSPRKKPRGFYRRRAKKNPSENYSKRNTVESFMHSLKSMKNSLRSKKHYMKKREFAWTIVTYNLEKLIQTTKTLIRLLFSNLIWDRPYFNVLLKKLYEFFTKEHYY